MAFSATIAVGYGKGGSETNLSKPLMEEEISWLSMYILVLRFANSFLTDFLPSKWVQLIFKKHVIFLFWQFLDLSLL